MVTPDTLSQWLKDQAWPIAFVIGFVALAFLLLKVSARRRQAKLMAERQGITEQSFSAHLERYGFDPTIAAATYRYLQQVQLVAFPILPSDALDEDLGLDSDDVQQTVTELTAALGREQAPGMHANPLVTVEDLVRLLQASPRRRVRAAAAA